MKPQRNGLLERTEKDVRRQEMGYLSVAHPCARSDNVINRKTQSLRIADSLAKMTAKLSNGTWTFEGDKLIRVKPKS